MTGPDPMAGSGRRLLVYLPSWVGDTVMATPALRLLRDAMPRAVILGLGRRGADELLAGLELLDDVVIEDTRGLGGRAAAVTRVRRLRIGAALLLPNSFGSAMIARLAAVPIRMGYDRDGRGMLLTHRLDAPRRQAPRQGWAPVSAVEYYLRAGDAFARTLGCPPAGDASRALTLGITPDQGARGSSLLERAGVREGERFVLLNPGGNNPAKRWPVERFAGVAHHVIDRHRLKAVLNGSPGERELVGLIRDAIVLNHPEDAPMVASLPELGVTVGTLKEVVRRAALLVTNDTGPRHIGAAFGTPTVTLFGPTDPRWSALPQEEHRATRIEIVAEPSLPPDELADDHPELCRIDRISVAQVTDAVDRLLGAG